MPPSLGSLLISAALWSVSVVHADNFPLPDGYDRYAPIVQGLKWSKCTENGGPNHECARFEVPLDWHNVAAGKASLAVVRHPAEKQPKLGTLFMNPGGPGESGADWVLTGSHYLMGIVDGRYDIVGWDPRGVGSSVPRAHCLKDAEEWVTFWNGTIPGVGLEARGNFTDKRDLDAFYGQVDQVDALMEKFGKRCMEERPDTFQYIGTAAVVRDMIALQDILEGPDKPINYWGMSYGTVIGSYFVNMFPDRVGRVVLDGVCDPWDWANEPAHVRETAMLESTDEAFTGFAMACAAAGPTGCAIAFENSTADSIRQWTRDLIDLAYDYTHDIGRAFAQVTSGSLRSEIHMGMYGPTGWPELAKKLADYSSFLSDYFASSNSTGSKRGLPFERRAPNSIDNVAGFDFELQAIRCADAIDPGQTTTKDVFDYVVNLTQTVSPMFGPHFAEGGYYCHRWPARAVERFTGPWNKKLANTILVIGNEADPITPYVSAKRVADALGDSAILIEQDDYGHVSIAMRSDCTQLALQDYFVNNKLPSQDKFCGTNQVLFPGPGVTKSTIAQLSSSNTLSNQSTLQTELDKTKQRTKKLFIAVVALAGAAGLLLITLLFSCLRNRKSSLPAHSMYVSRSFEKASGGEQGHTYDNPYAPGGGSKGGYSRVES